MAKGDAPKYRHAKGTPRCDECHHEDPPGSHYCKLFNFTFEKGQTCDAYRPPKDPERQRAILTRQMAHLEGVRGSINEGRKKLKDRAAKQADSMPHAIHTVNEHLERGKAGGILGFRRLRTLLTERRRLDGIAVTRDKK